MTVCADMKNPNIIPAAMISAAILAGFWMLKEPVKPAIDLHDLTVTMLDVNAKHKSESTPLHKAAEGGYKEIAELLIAKGAEVNAKSIIGMTPLHYAAMFSHKEIAELLIAKGADMNAKAIDGMTPMDCSKGETAILLREHGGKGGFSDTYPAGKFTE